MCDVEYFIRCNQHFFPLIVMEVFLFFHFSQDESHPSIIGFKQRLVNNLSDSFRRRYPSFLWSLKVTVLMTYWARTGNRDSHAVLQILCLTLSKCIFILLVIIYPSAERHTFQIQSLNQLEHN